MTSGFIVVSKTREHFGLPSDVPLSESQCWFGVSIRNDIPTLCRPGHEKPLLQNIYSMLEAVAQRQNTRSEA